MMKRFLLGLFSIFLLLGTFDCAKLDAFSCAKRKGRATNKVVVPREDTKEKRRLEREEKREKKGLERERKRQEREASRASKKKCETRDKENNSLKKEEQRKERELRKEQRRTEREEQRLQREQQREVHAREGAYKKEEAKKAKEDQKLEKLEKKGLLERYLDKIFSREENKKQKEEKLQWTTAEREKRSSEKASAKEERKRTICQREKEAKELKQLRRELMIKERMLKDAQATEGMASWKDIREKEVAQDVAEGRYADLYKVPSWPFEALFADHKKDLFRVTAKYDYATDAFNSKGSSLDLSSLAFGEKAFDLRDVLLSLKLNVNGILNRSDAAANENYVWSTLLGNDLSPTNAGIATYYNKQLNFYAKSEEYGLSLDYLRYLKGKDIAFGVQLPIGCKTHTLKLDAPVGNYGGVNSYLAYHSMLRETLDWVLEPKGLSYLPKMSTMGIGDVSTFFNFQVNSRYFEKLIVGINAIWPTAKEASTSKLWAPTLGNGGFTQFNVYLAALFNHQRTYFNPHFFLQATYQCAGNVNRRVPKMVKFSGNTNATRTYDTTNETYLKDMTAYGDKVLFAPLDQPQLNKGKAFSEWDTTIPAFADNSRKVKIRPGPEVNLRIGNMFEKFIFRRAFLDIFYDLKAKWQDSIGGDIPRDIWNVDSLKKDTHQIMQKLGLDYSYQFDDCSRMHLGANYVFAGINVPQVFDAAFTLATEF